jgi:hypothetical protein
MIEGDDCSSVRSTFFSTPSFLAFNDVSKRYESAFPFILRSVCVGAA